MKCFNLIIFNSHKPLCSKGVRVKLKIYLHIFLCFPGSGDNISVEKAGNNNVASLFFLCQISEIFTNKYLDFAVNRN